MAIAGLFVLLTIVLGLGIKYAEAAPLSNQSTSGMNTPAAACSNNFFDSTFVKYINDHPGWALSFSRQAVTEQNDGVLSPLQKVPLSNVCSFSVAVKPADSSNTFGFELVLPKLEQWNRRFLTVGNSAFSGAINRVHIANGVANGFATMGTDTGHPDNTDGSDETWAKDKDKRLDWAYRAMDRSIDLAKVMVEAYYNNNSINFSYYSGCSTGGRQGLKQITVNPKSFDGILVGAPAWDEKHLMGWITMIIDYNQKAGSDKLTTTDFSVIDSFVMKTCSNTTKGPPNDGIIPNSNVCNFTLDWNSIRCNKSNTAQGNCLSDKKIDIAKMLTADAYTPYTDNRDGLLYNGYSIGSALQWSTYLDPSVQGWGTAYEEDFLDMGPVTWDADEQNIVRTIENKDDWTVGDFSQLKYGGKIIMYHGTADGYIPNRSSQYLWNKTEELFPDIDSWFRYFEIPGMQHCFQTDTGLDPPTTHKPAPYYIGGAGQAQSIYSTFVPKSVGINDTQHDGLLALVEWVENRAAPTSIVATAWEVNTTSYEKSRQRPICPYPNSAIWKGDGYEPNSATSWSC